ncbi:IS1004 transposase [Vibrio cholerae]|nr:IS1004 transposase [Vibrio cholerae]
MGDYRSSSHVYWRCKYHIVWTPKFRFKILKGNVAKELNRSIYILCNMKDCEVFGTQCSARSCPLSCDNSAQSIDFDVDGSFKG